MKDIILTPCEKCSNFREKLGYSLMLGTVSSGCLNKNEDVVDDIAGLIRYIRCKHYKENNDEINTNQH